MICIDGTWCNKYLQREVTLGHDTEGRFASPNPSPPETIFMEVECLFSLCSFAEPKVAARGWNFVIQISLWSDK